jgi:hypothetical protein
MAVVHVGVINQEQKIRREIPIQFYKINNGPARPVGVPIIPPRYHFAPLLFRPVSFRDSPHYYFALYHFALYSI